MSNVENTDVAIIGGGFYGAYAAEQVKKARPELDVIVVEEKDRPFTRASSTNQGQFHMGYMYSGDVSLARECVENIERFEQEFGAAIDHDTISYYGIHEQSEISPEAFEAFCGLVGLRAMRQEITRHDLVNDQVSALYRTPERTFNSKTMQDIILRKFGAQNIRLVTNFGAHSVTENSDGQLNITTNDGREIHADTVFNAAFADINSLHERSGLPLVPMQYDSFLHFVLKLPDTYRNTGLTIIRGPYASLLPSAFRDGHILASAGHRRVASSREAKPNEEISPGQIESVYRAALADASTYMPLIQQSEYKGHTLGIRVAHIEPETGQYTSKALVFEDFGDVKNYHTVLGGKVSCMFDIADSIQKIVNR